MRKIKFLFPLLFLIALAGSAFTRQSAQKVNAFGVNAYYKDPYGYCNSLFVNDPNCSPTLNGPVCYEYVNGIGWTVMYEFGTATVCWQPYYSLYPNNP